MRVSGGDGGGHSDTIERFQGFAIGVMGMSVEDFECMDTDEFSSACNIFNEHEESLYRSSWERARIVGALCVSPYAKGRVRPEKLLPFPWEKNGISKTQNMKTQKPVSKEEDLRRLKMLMGK